MNRVDSYQPALRLLAVGCLLLVCGLNIGCLGTYAKTTTPAPPKVPAPSTAPTPPFTPVMLGDRPGLHNVIQLSSILYSGSSPDGKQGFRSLRDLGIKSIVSVDGAQPDVATAQQFGLQYGHMPIGYGSVPRESAVRIAHALRDLPTPVYIHCHHGKHRGPAAAIAAYRCLDGSCSVAAAKSFLQIAGTDAKYQGLFRSVEQATLATPEEWERNREPLTPTVTVPDLVRLMVQLDEHWDRMKQIRTAGWKTPADHPDLTPQHEAVQVRELYREALRLKHPQAQRAEMHKWMQEAEVAAKELEEALQEKAPNLERANSAFTRSAALCTKCHGQFRDQ